MAASQASLTAADLLVQRLRAHGVRHIFGYPGGQITPIYDALYREPSIRHVLARDEQAAAFMADGYARATGKPGVCLAVCGPGVLNAATPLASAFTDSIPVLLISGQVASAGLGLRSGSYHENDQLNACATFTKWRARADNGESIATAVDGAFAALTTGRPGPVLLEAPVDVLRATVGSAPLAAPQSSPKVIPQAGRVVALAELIAQWRKPLLIAGGGVISAGAESLLVQAAERLGAPVFTTLMGKCAIPTEHPLAMGLPWRGATSDVSDMRQFMSPLFDQTDGVLVVGCRFSQVSTGSWSLPMLALLAQIDIDPAEIGRHYRVTLGIEADARETLQTLLSMLPTKKRAPWISRSPREPWRLPGIDLLEPMRRVLPKDTIIAADITRLSYIMLAEFPVYQTRTFLHPAGFVPMGFGIPAALGAKTAFPQRTVVAVLGDGCFLMSGMELATAVQEKLPIVVILINDNSLTLIKAIQQRRYENRFIGVDLHNPDFQMFARAFGVRSWQVDSDLAFERALREAVALREPTLIEVKI